MKKLLALFPRTHQPDAELLSALLDGRLDAAPRAAAETHVAACRACTARLGELRQIRSMLAAMPHAEAPRSFRLRQADVEAAPAPARRSPALRAMPALGGLAMVAFVVVLGADLATRPSNNGDSSQTAFGVERQSGNMFDESVVANAPAASAPGPSGGIAADEAPAAEAFTPDAPEAPPAGAAGADTARSPEDAAVLTPVQALDADGYRDGPAPEPEQIKSMNYASDDDGSRTGFRIAEAAALAVGLGALAIAACAWISRRGTS